MNTDIIISFLRVVTGTGILYLLYVMLLKKHLGGTFSRFFIIGGTTLFSTLPFIGFITQKPVSTETVYLVTLPEVVLENNPSSYGIGINWISMLYIIPAVIFFLIFCWKLWCIFKLNRTGITYTTNGVSCTQTDHIKYPFSFGSRIYIPKGIDESSKGLVIAHELVHIRHLHTLDILFFEALKIMAWFNPFYYLLEKELRQTHEFTVDEIMLRNGTSMSIYCDALLSCALVGMKVPANYFNGSQIKTRIYMMNKQKNVKKTVALFTVATGMLFGVYATTPNLFGQAAKTPAIVASEVDKIAEYPGGQEALTKFFVDNVKYPQEAMKNKIEGKVFVDFTVTENGDITDVKIKRGIGSGCDEEAVRVIKKMPRWKPAEKDGKIVASKMNIPIFFKLS